MSWTDLPRSPLRCRPPSKWSSRRSACHRTVTPCHAPIRKTLMLGQEDAAGHCIFCDCSAESPPGRRSLCCDRAALDSRKENKPQGSAAEAAAAMGLEMLDERQYRHLQQLGEFDTKTSSWVATPEDVRALGGALFCDRRYGKVFVYHNGAQSCYAARGFRGLLRV